jgi:hypothetical protein
MSDGSLLMEVSIPLQIPIARINTSIGFSQSGVLVHELNYGGVGVNG